MHAGPRCNFGRWAQCYFKVPCCWFIVIQPTSRGADAVLRSIGWEVGSLSAHFAAGLCDNTVDPASPPFPTWQITDRCNVHSTNTAAMSQLHRKNRFGWYEWRLLCLVQMNRNWGTKQLFQHLLDAQCLSKEHCSQGNRFSFWSTSCNGTLFLAKTMERMTHQFARRWQRLPLVDFAVQGQEAKSEPLETLPQHLYVCVCDVCFSQVYAILGQPSGSIWIRIRWQLVGTMKETSGRDRRLSQSNLIKALAASLWSKPCWSASSSRRLDSGDRIMILAISHKASNLLGIWFFNCPNHNSKGTRTHVSSSIQGLARMLEQHLTRRWNCARVPRRMPLEWLLYQRTKPTHLTYFWSDHLYIIYTILPLYLCCSMGCSQAQGVQRIPAVPKSKWNVWGWQFYTTRRCGSKPQVCVKQA